MSLASHRLVGNRLQSCPDLRFFLQQEYQHIQEDSAYRIYRFLYIGEDRELCVLDYKYLTRAASQAGVAPSVANVRHIEHVKSCHLFAAGVEEGAVFVCAAMPDRITVLKYNSSMGTFCLKKVVLN